MSETFINENEWYWSASRLKMLNDCAYQFYRKYIIKDLPSDSNPFSMLGSAIHATLEHYRVNKDWGIKDVVATFQQELKREYGENKVDYWIENDGKRMLFSLKRDQIFNGELIGVEKEFDVVIDGIRFFGLIDKLEKIGSNTLYISDYKTNKSIEVEDYIKQLVIYDIVCSVLYPEYTDRIVNLQYLRFNKKNEYRISEDTKNNFISDLKKIQDHIFSVQGNKAAFPKRKTKDKCCTFCPLIKECW